MELKSTSEKFKTENTLQRAAYEALCYFDIFKYPLKKEEIQNFCSSKISADELEIVLTELLDSAKIKQHGEYYLLDNAQANTIETRIENEARLKKKTFIIKRFARFVSRFPFVRAVFISGSVSKGIFKSDSDVDYFIITEPNRLWVCRTFLILFKKIFLLNSKKYFCVNYFVSSDNLKIPDENLFVATEIKTLIPVFENELISQFKQQNEWANNYLPNFHKVQKALYYKEIKTSWLSRLTEKICSGSFGEELDNYFFLKTLSRWRKKFPHFKLSEFDLNMRSYKNVSKHHPLGHQFKVAEALNLRMKNF
ncbi:MAG: nucleotidyltransferase domain-containing protein [Bacteroidetes bacterium]|nr:nucleotidyltransferase domain-containing protein [Bacteroidota bacterium]